MKYLLRTCVMLIVLLLGSFEVSAQDNEKILLSSQESKNNRLFDVTVTLENMNELCGGKLRFEYDSNMIEYKSATDKSAQVQEILLQQAVELVFVSCDGQGCDEHLATLTFKGKSQGQSFVKVSATECVNKNLEEIKVDTQALQVNISGNAVSCKSYDYISETTDKSKIISDSDMNSGESQNDSTTDQLNTITLKHSDENHTTNKIVFWIGCAVVVVLCLCLVVVKQRKENKVLSIDKEE